MAVIDRLWLDDSSELTFRCWTASFIYPMEMCGPWP